MEGEAGAQHFLLGPMSSTVLLWNKFMRYKYSAGKAANTFST